MRKVNAEVYELLAPAHEIYLRQYGLEWFAIGHIPGNHYYVHT